MNIPNSFKNAIKNTFYDKMITLYSKETLINEEGWARDKVIMAVDTFLANTSFDRLDRIQQDYGLQETIDIIITTDYQVPDNSILGYGGKAYKTIRVIPRDSHYYIIAQIWSSKSSTWTSL